MRPGGRKGLCLLSPAYVGIKLGVQPTFAPFPPPEDLPAPFQTLLLPRLSLGLQWCLSEAMKPPWLCPPGRAGPGAAAPKPLCGMGPGDKAPLSPGDVALVGMTGTGAKEVAGLSGVFQEPMG